MDLVVIGHVSIDHIRYPGKDEIRIPGGGGAAVATSASLINEKVGLVTRIGEDFPEEWLKKLQTFLDTEGVQTLKGETINIYMIYDENGNVEAPVSGGSVAENIGKIKIPKKYKNPKIYHLAPMPPKEQLKLIKRLNNNIISIDYNPTYMKEYKQNKKTLKEIASKVNIAFPNQKEAKTITEENNIKKAAKKLHQWGTELVIITHGQKGGIIYNGKKFRKYNALPIKEKEIVDQTGAGDSFIGGFLANYTKEQNIDQSIKQGTKRAKKVLQKKGSWSIECSIL